MNSGAYRVKESFYDASTVEGIYRKIRKSEWKPTWENKAYAGNHWMSIKLITDGEKTPIFIEHPEIQKVVDMFQCKIHDMMFYSLLPGGELHPHRDMVGAVGLGGLRFHLPLITNPTVDFRVSRKRVVMSPGELWALDTSYLHSVSNHGPEERVHLVFDVKVNDWVRSIIPKPDHRYYLHQVALVGLAVHKYAKIVLFQPRLLKANLNVAKNVIKMMFAKLKRS